jgi:hypothetical protein
MKMMNKYTNIHMYGVIMTMQFELKTAYFFTSTLYNKRTCYLRSNGNFYKYD